MPEVSEKKELKNCLETGTVIVQFIPDFTNGISDKGHPLYGGLSSNASISVPAPLLTRRIDKIFTEEELAFLGEKLSEDLKPTSGFWKEHRKDENGMPTGYFPIFLKKEGMFLDKSDPLDFIKFRILQDSNVVASSPKEKNYQKYRFVLIEQDEIHKEDIDFMQVKKKANKLHTKYENNEEVLRYLLRSFNKNVNRSNKLPFLQKETFKLAELDPRRFNMVMEDEFIETKILLDAAVDARLVSVSNKQYYTATGEPLKMDGKKNDYEGAARFLKSGAGQETMLKLEAQIKAYNKKRDE